MKGFKGTAVHLYSAVSEENSTTTPLLSAGQFIGTWIETLGYSSVIVAARSDVDGNLYMQFSPDGINVDSSLPFKLSGATNEVHRVVITRKYFRVLYINNGTAQTSFRLQCTLGNFESLTTPFNQVIGQDSDAALVKSISDEILIAGGLLEGYSIVNKFGYNPDVDNTGNEDIWGGDGFYTGFPSAAETIEVFSSSVLDTAAGTGARTIRITGLDSDYNVISETVTLNGITPVLTTQSFLRAHTCLVLSAGSGGLNAGTITIRQSTTVANIFLVIQIGRNQSNNSAYTVPAGYTAYMRTLHIACATSIATHIDGNIWTKTFGQVFRSRRPFFISNNFRLDDIIYGGIVLTEKSDIVLRINTCSSNNIPVNGGYDLLLVRN